MKVLRMLVEHIHSTKNINTIIKENNDENLTPISDEYGVYKISFGMWEAFLEGLAKVNKNAAKYGVPPLQVANKTKVIIRKEQKETRSEPYKPAVLGWEVHLQGEPVRINGWEFLASLEHVGPSNNIRFVPGKEDPRVRAYATASNHNCDFCHSNRDRNNTYIVRNIKDNEIKQVGGQCLQKYIGDNARKLAKFAFHMDEFIGGLEDYDDDGEGSGERRGRRGVNSTDVQTTLAAAMIIINKFGFVRSNDSDRASTSSLVSTILFDYGNKDFNNHYKDIIERIRNITEDDRKKADDIVEWFNALPDEQKQSSYMISLESVINSDMVTPRSMGIMVSLPAVYYRATTEQKAKAETVKSQWVGTVGEKIPATNVIVVHASMHDGSFGPYQLVKMKAEDGNVYTWFNTSSNKLEADKKYSIVGAIKKHDEYKGEKTTTLTRVKAKEI